jgi:hypothetical protein
MEQLEIIAAKFAEIRRKSTRGRYPNILKEQVVQLSEKIPQDIINTKLGIHPNTIYKWKRQLLPKEKSDKFIKIALPVTPALTEGFDITLCGTDISFSKRPEPKWFAQIIRELQ